MKRKVGTSPSGSLSLTPQERVFVRCCSAIPTGQPDGVLHVASAFRLRTTLRYPDRELCRRSVKTDPQTAPACRQGVSFRLPLTYCVPSQEKPGR